MLPAVLILRAPGTNCDQETAFAFQRAGAQTDRLHIARLLEQPSLCEKFQILCIPGGFSYGDDVAAGRILSTKIRYHLSDMLHAFFDSGKLILGICNGFQVLLKSGLLFPEDQHGHLATLTCNDSSKFEVRWVNLQVHNSSCVLLSGIQQLQLPVAHAEGKFVIRDTSTSERLEKSSQLTLRYRSSNGNVTDPVSYPDNPNGSQKDVAGVCDSSGRVLGLMPHPERYVEATQHPSWTRQKEHQIGDGMKIFQNAVHYFS